MPPSACTDSLSKLECFVFFKWQKVEGYEARSCLLLPFGKLSADTCYLTVPCQMPDDVPNLQADSLMLCQFCIVEECAVCSRTSIAADTVWIQSVDAVAGAPKYHYYDDVYDFEKSLGKSKFTESTLEGKVLCNYGTYKIEKGKFGRYLKTDLLDKESKNTIMFVVSEIYIADFVNLLEVEDFVRVEEHRIRELLVAALTSALAQFNPTIAFTVVEEESIAKSDGSSSCRLTIADGPAIIDRASLLFVPSRQVDYHTIVNAVNEQGCFSCVAHNINVFRQQTNTLSVVDAIVLLELPSSLETNFRSHLSKQVCSSGFGKKIFGTLEIINVNSLNIQYTCDYCKGSNVSRQVSNPFCFTCGKLSTILKTPILQAKLIPQSGEGVVVALQGGILDAVLGLSQHFMRLYEENLVDLKSSLATIKKVGTFVIDNHENVAEFKHA
ncbi:hypothetical protein L7F22_036266 [Adiantum nelumboides]|nr:hypothetical protein [Adiantum nelumboides]